MAKLNDINITVNVDVDMVFGFGVAIQYLKNGHKLARKGWNGKGIYIKLQTPDVNLHFILYHIK